MSFFRKFVKGAGQPAIAESLGGLIKKQGGLDGLLDKFKDAGLQDKAESWVSTGENQEVSASQVEAALGEKEVERLADEAGVTKEEAAAQIAEVLPEMVNELTPAGTVPPPEEVERILSSPDGSVQTPDASAPNNDAPPAPEASAAPEFYTVQSGDTLSSIAQRLYGDENAYVRIFEANRDKLNDPNMIQPGQDLLIPR